MNQEIKKLKFLLTLTLAGLLLFSCQIEEEALMRDKSLQKFNVQQKSYQELMQTSVFNNAISKLTNKSQNVSSKSEQQSKTIMEDQYGFTILDSPINVAETSEIQSYSIFVKSDSQTCEDYFENLVVNVNKLTNVLSAYLVKHKLAPISNPNNPHRSLIASETTIKQITYNNQNLSARIETTCHTLFIPMCQKPWEDSGEEEPFQYTAPHPLTTLCLEDINYITVQEQQVCIDNFFSDDDGPTPIGDPSTGGSNNHGGSTGTNNPVVTAPVPPPCTRNCVDVGKEPCIKLNILDQDTNFKARLNGLKAAAEQWSVEKLHTLYNAPSPQASNNYTYQDFQGGVNGTTANYGGNTNMVGVLHSHYDGLLSIFSPQDLRDLYNYMKNPLITDDFFIGLVNSKGTAYILQIADRAKFVAFGDANFATDEKFKKFEIDVWQEKYKILPSNSNAVNEKAFLEMMSNLNGGISLASTSFIPNVPITPTTFSNWTKKTYNRITQNVDSSDCN